MMFEVVPKPLTVPFRSLPTLYRLFRPSIELSEPKSWIFNVIFSDLVLQSNVQVIDRKHGYQHSFVVSYCVLNSLTTLVAVSALQKKI